MFLDASYLLFGQGPAASVLFCCDLTPPPIGRHLSLADNQTPGCPIMSDFSIVLPLPDHAQHFSK